jgi:hypothetical protein
MAFVVCRHRSAYRTREKGKQHNEGDHDRDLYFQVRAANPVGVILLRERMRVSPGGGRVANLRSPKHVSAGRHSRARHRQLNNP